MQRRRIVIEGVVQGVGFRPFVCQTARRFGLAGSVHNDCRGVVVEAQGYEPALASFLAALYEEAPPLATITGLTVETIPPRNETSFSIGASVGNATAGAQIAPDAFVCGDCLNELFNPADRRYRYPFINCTNCGPRYSLIEAIPYDRPRTTMADFAMCPACLTEYRDPASRRFHAQPNACPECGPSLVLCDAAGTAMEAGDCLAAAAELLRSGKVLAVKGIGGYHLTVDACNPVAVATLRQRKLRDEKPFALMAADLDVVRSFAEIDASESRLLSGVERPIVLLRQRPGNPIAAGVAPRNRYFGVMLPYAPLHHLLLRSGPDILVMTSGNRADEPIAFTDASALQRLAGIADAFLLHNRRIHIRSDDSVARLMAGKALLLRRSRGFVPRSLHLLAAQPPVLALGAELKNAICLTRGEDAYLSEHIGDLKNLESLAAFQGAIGHLQQLLEVTPRIVAHDLHPDYLSTRHALSLAGVTPVAVQHHHAHLVSCLGENRVAGPAIGVIFDGSGYGEDGRVWGGEFLIGDAAGYRRAAHLTYLPMPGGDAAVREPWRMAVSYLRHSYGEGIPAIPALQSIPAMEQRIVAQMIDRRINAPLTSSCGRLFDGVAALIGLRPRVSFEGQAAMELEMVAAPAEQGAYPSAVERIGNLLEIDPALLIRAVVDDLHAAVPVAAISARFHRGVAHMVFQVCRILRAESGLSLVALSGGVFQNVFLTETVLALLRDDDFTVLTHSLVPPNDGGLALGQAIIAAQRIPPFAPPTAGAAGTGGLP
ncbi:MAG: carbamoyltransferase HypF [Desulfuromonadales bacterium GWD2_61_12]|nr:MAG: carbamoyltransferase HypF [Desulfuromonadales bacterium GWC2_61_20]OGR34460.1 MAG: carbamoyltransferase HypF [Desulfuromonadales bacterium GWD2_61_12]